MSTGKIELSVGAIKIADKYEIFTEEEIDNINKIPAIEDELEETVKFEIVGEGTTVPPISGGGSNYDDTEIREMIDEVNESLDDIVIYVSKFPRLELELNDSKRIQRAIDYCKNNNYKTLVLDDNKYVINGAIKIAEVKELNIKSSVNTIIQLDNNVATTSYLSMLLFEITSSSNIKIDGCNFYGNFGGQSTPHASATSFYRGFVVSNSDKIVFENCNFKNFKSNAINVLYKDWYKDSSTDYEVMKTRKGVHGLEIKKCIFNDVANALQVICSDSKGIKITDNDVNVVSEHAFSFYPYTTNIIIDNNTITNNAHVGIRCYGNSNVVITNNNIANTGIGISSDGYGTDNITNNIMIDNNVINTFNNVYSNGVGIGANGSHIAITNNKLSNTGEKGINISGYNINVSNNAVDNVGAFGIIIENNPNNNSIKIYNNNINHSGNVGIHTLNFSKANIKNNYITNCKRQLQISSSSFESGNYVCNFNYYFENKKGNAVVHKAPKLILPKDGKILSLSYEYEGDLSESGALLIIECYKNEDKIIDRRLNNSHLKRDTICFNQGVVDDELESTYFNKLDKIEFAIKPFNTANSFNVAINVYYELY